MGELKNRERDNLYLGKMSGSIGYTLDKIAQEFGILTLDQDKVSSEIIQQTTKNGIDFEFVVMDIEDYKLPPMAEVEKRLQLREVRPQLTEVVV